MDRSRGVCVCGCSSTEQAIVRHVNFQQVKCVLLGSPGFVKDDFFEFLNLEAIRREERVSESGIVHTRGICFVCHQGSLAHT